MRSWLIRLGKFGEMEQRALQAGELVTGWKLGNLKGATIKEAILPIVARLVALNHERAAEEKAGKVRWLRPDYQEPRFGNTTNGKAAR